MLRNIYILVTLQLYPGTIIFLYCYQFGSTHIYRPNLGTLRYTEEINTEEEMIYRYHYEALKMCQALF